MRDYAMPTSEAISLSQKAIDSGVDEKLVVKSFANVCKSFGFDLSKNYDSLAELMDDYLRERKKHLYDYTPYTEREV